MSDPQQYEIEIQNAIKLHSEMKIDQAIVLYRKLINIYPGRAVSHYYLAMALLQKGLAPEGLDQMHQAMQMEPENPVVLAGMGDALTSVGRLSESLAYYEKSIAIDPSSLPALLNFGANLNDLGRTKDSVEIFRQIVREHPDFHPGWNNLGNALIEIGQPHDAIEPLQKAVELAPSSFEAFSNLAKALNELGQNETALAMAQRAVDCHSFFSPALFQLGRAQLELGNPAEAKKSLSKALDHSSEPWPALALLGTCCEELGDTRGALIYWDSCLRKKPDHAAVLGQLAARLRQKTPADQVAQMQLLLNKKSTKLSDKEYLAYGLAHYSDATGDYSSAVKYLDQFSFLRQSGLETRGLKYNSEEFALHVNRISEISLSLQRLNPQVNSHVRMIFVTGMPRSGTSLLEQILASHPEISGAGELTWFPELVKSNWPLFRNNHIQENIAEKIRSEYFRRVSERELPTKFVVDKLPDNFYYLPILQKIFPESLFLICQRDIRDTALSQRFTRFARVRWNSSWENQFSRFEIYYRQFQKITRENHHNLNVIHYENLASDIKTEIEPLLKKIGLGWHEACLNFHATQRPVHTASAAQVRQPLYQSSIGKFRHYNIAYADEFEKLDEIQKGAILQ